MSGKAPNVATGSPELYKQWTSQSIVVVLIIAALFTIVLVVIYIVSMVRRNSLQNVVLHDKIITIDNRDMVPHIIESTKMSLVEHGHEFSYSFWIYLGDNYMPTSSHKLIFQRGNAEAPTATGDIVFDSGANPIVFMDKNTNKMYFAFSNSAVRAGAKSLDDIILKTNLGYSSKYLITYIDYVPLQRWVNISFALKDNTAYVFMDGDMYSAVSVNDLPIAPRPVIKGTKGAATIGDKKNAAKGFISLTRYFNYSLTQSEVQNIYNSGPVKKSILGFIGLDNYGVRTPVYNLTDEAANR